MPITSPGNDDDTGENHQPTLRKNTAEPVEQTLKQNNRAGGPEALRPRPKGRPKGAKSKPKPEPTREQELAEEVAYLKAKVAYLEKLRALRAQKSRDAREAPSSDCSRGGDTGSTSS